MCRDLKRRLGADVLSDGGDCLQGSAWTCYANEVANGEGRHLVACEMNEMNYDVGVIGNHDIEAGQEVMSRWVKDCEFPVLGANVMAEGVLPYTVLEREGLRIAVVGFVTTAVKQWIAREKWDGLEMKNLVECARKWVKMVRDEEGADVVVGILHSGWEGGMKDENEARRVAEQVCGFDLILYGHDHHANVHRVRNCAGKEVLCVGAGCGVVAVIDMPLGNEKKNVGDCDAAVSGAWRAELVNISGMVEKGREERYPEYREWLNMPICELLGPISERDSFFGPSAFITLFHNMQKWATGADVSFASPVNFDSYVEAGVLAVRDLFTLYKFNTELYTMELAGREILGVLEMSYALWTNRMTSADDEALLMDYILDNGTRKGLKNVSLNMLSASGIDYEVDLTKEVGQRVRIKQLSCGVPFSLTATYKVAINSYHASGGGGLLTEGAGIAKEELRSRVLSIHKQDSRACLRRYLEEMKVYAPCCEHNWRFVPEEWTTEALRRDRLTVFG